MDNLLTLEQLKEINPVDEFISKASRGVLIKFDSDNPYRSVHVIQKADKVDVVNKTVILDDYGSFTIGGEAKLVLRPMSALTDIEKEILEEILKLQTTTDINILLKAHSVLENFLISSKLDDLDLIGQGYAVAEVE